MTASSWLGLRLAPTVTGGRTHRSPPSSSSLPWEQLWEHTPPLKAAKMISFHPEQGPGARTGCISTLTQEEMRV